MKRWLMCMITIVMIVSIFFTLPIQASANINIGDGVLNQYTAKGELSILTPIVYNADSDFIFSAGVITGLTTAGKTRTSLDIPAKIGGVIVTSIGSDAFHLIHCTM